MAMGKIVDALAAVAPAASSGRGARSPEKSDQNHPMAESLQLDDKAWRLLLALQQDGRAPLKALAEAAGLSIAATAERLKRLQDAGVLSGVHAELDAARSGYPVRAIVGITVTQPGKQPFVKRLQAAPEVLECHHVAGADSYVMTVVARDLADLERFLATINAWGETRTSIVFSTPIPRRGLVPPGSPRR
jgi:Lrp/AsnC family leucine-responsive transcriptional regulator